MNCQNEHLLIFSRFSLDYSLTLKDIDDKDKRKDHILYLLAKKDTVGDANLRFIYNLY